MKNYAFLRTSEGVHTVHALDRTATVIDTFHRMFDTHMPTNNLFITETHSKSTNELYKYIYHNRKRKKSIRFSFEMSFTRVVCGCLYWQEIKCMKNRIHTVRMTYILYIYHMFSNKLQLQQKFTLQPESSFTFRVFLCYFHTSLDGCQQISSSLFVFKP
jgi:hypothetical protein